MVEGHRVEKRMQQFPYQQWFVCPKCKRAFREKYNFQNHAKLCRTEKCKACPGCDKVIANNYISTLFRDMLSPTSEIESQAQI